MLLAHVLIDSKKQDVTEDYMNELQNTNLLQVEEYFSWIDAQPSPERDEMQSQRLLDVRRAPMILKTIWVSDEKLETLCEKYWTSTHAGDVNISQRSYTMLCVDAVLSFTLQGLGGEREQLANCQLSWWTHRNARQLLRATSGDVEQATKRMQHAMQWRLSHKKLLDPLGSGLQVTCDARLLCKDKYGRPLLYGCMRSQKKGTAELQEQVIVALEAAIGTMDQQAEQVIVVWDWYGFRAWPNMNPLSVLEFGDGCKSHFSERIALVFNVDFPRSASFLWSAVKTKLPCKTLQKNLFVSQEEVLEALSEPLGVKSLEWFDIQRVMDTNRDPGSTEEERIRMAMSTCICSAPLGGLRSLC